MIVVGLTGSIGTGKSTVSSYLKQVGFYVIDADDMARKMLHKGSHTYNKIVEYFGHNILDAEGTINRKSLANIVFNHKEKLSVLESITTEVVLDRIKEELLANQKKYDIIIIDAPLLIEKDLHLLCDYVIVLDTDEEKIIERVIRRDGVEEKSIKERLKNQMNSKEKMKHATHVIKNDHSIDDLLLKVDKIIGEIKNDRV